MNFVAQQHAAGVHAGASVVLHTLPSIDNEHTQVKGGARCLAQGAGGAFVGVLCPRSDVAATPRAADAMGGMHGAAGVGERARSDTVVACGRAEGRLRRAPRVAE